jgi:hypothetical protein
MKQAILDELSTVEAHLRITHNDDPRTQQWIGYRDALLWVLSELKKCEFQCPRCKSYEWDYICANCGFH